MPNAQALRLRDALRDYVNAYNGDTGTGRRGGTRRQIPDTDKALVKGATELLSQLDGNPLGDAVQRDTPGSRARDRASTGGRDAASQGWAGNDLKTLLGAPPQTTPSNDGGNT